MTERHHEQQRPRTGRRTLAAIGLASTLASGCALPGSPAYNHMPVLLRQPGEVTNGPQSVHEKVNCYDIVTYTQSGKPFKIEPAYPQEIVYVGGTDEHRVWGAVTDVSFGTVESRMGRKIPHLNKVTVWVAQNYGGPSPQRVTFAHGGGNLPFGWENMATSPYMFDDKGFLMMQIPDVTFQKMPAEMRQAPHVTHEYGGQTHDLTEYDKITLRCENHGEFISPDLVQEVNIPPQTWTNPMAPPPAGNSVGGAK